MDGLNFCHLRNSQVIPSLEQDDVVLDVHTQAVHRQESVSVTLIIEFAFKIVENFVGEVMVSGQNSEISIFFLLSTKQKP